MQVVITVESGARTGNKLQLQEGQQLVFGRTQWADVDFPYDARMADKHFSLDAHGGRLRLLDLGTAGGTAVNDKAVQEAWLQDGDTILAGETRLAISIEGGAEGPPPEATTANATSTPRPVTYTRQTCMSGLTRLRGGKVGESNQAPPVSAVAGALAESSPMTVIVHPRQMDADPEAFPEAVPLFDWLPEQCLPAGSPLILPPGTSPKSTAVIDAHWDKNAVLCFFSKRPADELIQHLRAAVHFDIGEESDEVAAVAAEDQPAATSGDEMDQQESAAEDSAKHEALLGYCWPNVLSPLLDFGRPELVKRLMEGIDAVLMEVPDEAECWQTVSGSDLSETLQSAGIHESPEADDQAE